ncbi:flagellar export protein FliJ [Endozoicomonas ascidiicola]|uniref:flagellar export protein FliJ n=1 Tax=Endozoicomonas ascidiicola TaxID=1698521 RepID=UPI000837A50E|nr:flagellar export protein FliJ [Endozoicomonas ascidiicola]
MTQRKDGLTHWRELQQSAFEEEKRASVQARQKLEEEQDRLLRLDSFQQNLYHQQGRQITTLELQANWQFSRQLDHVIRHQRQQLAVEQSQYRRREALLVEQQKKLKTADKLLQKKKEALIKQYQRSEQKVLDELSAGFALRQDEFA